MISLAGITLPDDMVIENLFSWQPLSGSVKRTMGGRVCIYHSVLSEGRPINLVATRESGWIRRSTYDQLYQLTLSPQVMALVYDARSYSVVFRFGDEPVLDFNLLIPRPNDEATDYLIGTIKLLEV